jgi:transposase
MVFIENLCLPQIKFLQRIFKESKKHHVRQRAHCILLSYQRFKVTDLAKVFGKTERTIYTWLNQWESQHFAGLYDEKGRGRKPKLNDDQRQQIKKWSKEFPKNLKKVVALVRETYGVPVSKRTIKRILRNINFSWRRVRKKPKGEPDPVEYAKKKDELEELEKEAEAGIIDLCYFDESGFSLDPYIPYAWQEIGETIELESSRGKHLSVIGFLSKHREFVGYTTEGKVDSAFVIACIEDFINELRQKTVLVMDNSSFHTSCAIEAKIPEWRIKNLEIFYLPKYSPWLNLIEILWRFMKYDWLEWWAYKGWSSLVEYVEMIIRGYGTEYEINFG